MNEQAREREKKEHADFRKPEALATAALWLAPIAWLLDLLASSSLTPIACAQGRAAVLRVPALLALLLLGVALAIHRGGGGPENPGRAFTARVAFGLSLFFALVVFVSFLPIAIVPPCAS